MGEVKSSDFSDVFVSYRRKDVEFTKELVEALQQSGKEVWIDWEDIPPGSVGFSDDIKRGLEGADAFIAVLTPDYLESPYCVDMELKYAVELKKKLIPIVLKKFDGYDIPADISHINWIYFTPHAGHENDFEESMPKVMQALDTDLEHVRTHKRLLLRALEWDGNERKSSYLMRGNALTEAEAWLAAAPNKVPDPTELHTQFIFESRKATAAQQRQLLIAASVAAVLMAFLAVFAGFQWREAVRQEAIAKANEEEAILQRGIAEENAIIAQNNEQEARSLALAANAQLNLSGNNIDLAVALGLEGSEIEQAPQDTVLVLDEAAHLPGTRFLLGGHDAAINAVALHPDQMHALSGGEDMRLILWDITSGENVRELAGHEAEVLSITFNNEGHIAASSDSNGVVTIWDTETGEATQTIAQGYGPANAVIFTQDDTGIIVGYSDGTVQRYDVETGDTVWQQLEHVHGVISLAISPDGTQFVAGESAGSDDNPNSLIVSDIETGDVVSTTSDVENIAINDIAYSPDGTSVLLTIRSNVVEWSLENNVTIREFTGHSSVVRGVAVSPGGVVVSASDDTNIRRWERIGEGRGIWTFAGHVRSVNDVVLSDDGRTMVTVSSDAIVRVWDVENGALLSTAQGHRDDVTTIDFGMSESDVFTISYDAQVIRLNAETGETTVLAEHPGWASGLDYIPATDLILSVGAQGQLYLLNPETGDIESTLEGYHEGQWVTKVAVTSDGTRAISGDNGGGVAFWNLEDETLINGIEIEDSQIRNVDMSDDDSLAVAVTSNGQVILFDMETYEEITRWVIAGEPTIWSVQFVPNSDTLATGQAGGRVILFDMEGNIIRTFNGHSGVVYGMAISDDGTLLATGATDESLRLWDVATGTELRRLNLNESIASIKFNADGTLAYVGLLDGKLVLVNINQQNKEDLIQWVQSNRYIAEFNCLQKQFYRLDLTGCDIEE